MREGTIVEIFPAKDKYTAIYCFELLMVFYDLSISAAQPARSPIHMSNTIMVVIYLKTFFFVPLAKPAMKRKLVLKLRQKVNEKWGLLEVLVYR